MVLARVCVLATHATHAPRAVEDTRRATLVFHLSWFLMMNIV